MALLRSGGGLPGEPSVGSHMLHSTCELPADGADYSQNHQHQRQQLDQGSEEVVKETYHVCRPGTGLFNVGLPGDRMPASTTVGTPAQRKLHIPAVDADAAGAAATGPWPGYTPIPVGKHCNWTAPIVTSIPDSQSRACTAPLPVSIPGFQYPAAMWKLDGPRGPEILFSYSVNKVRCARQSASSVCLSVFLRFLAVIVVSHT
jgi:hypothetical protein